MAIFASGGGSNARCIMEHFQDHPDIRVGLVVCNKAGAGVLNIAHEFGIPTHLIDRQGFYNTENLLDVLKRYHIQLIALAGFLWLVPSWLIRAYPRKIVNIHPALLPEFGGKGMYGHFVHEAVKAAGKTSSGMTIHFANEHYDEGDIVFQATCALEPDDTPDDIARKVLVLEHRHYPSQIEKLVSQIE